MRALKFLHIEVSQVHEQYNNEVRYVHIEIDPIHEGFFYLTKDDMLLLSEEFREIASGMNDLEVCKRSSVNLRDIEDKDKD